MMWKQWSEELQATAARVAPGLVHVGGGEVAGRTGVVWADGVVVTVARQAQTGESVPVVLFGGLEAVATVAAWDPRTGLALLNVPGARDPGWKTGSPSALGALGLTVAFPSPQGPEVRLDLVRFVGRDSDWGRGVKVERYFQTDAGSFPGFTGAVVVDSEANLLGFVADNHPGNDGLVVSGSDFARIVGELRVSGSPKQAWLGVSTRPAAGQGLALLDVEAGSPADRAHWKAGDLLLSLGGRPLKSPRDLMEVLAKSSPGAAILARVLRDGEVFEWPVTPTERP